MRRVIFALLIPLFLVGCWENEPELLRKVEGNEYVSRGEALVNGLGACAVCHSDKVAPGAVLSGGQVFQDRYGKVTGPNLTQAKTGLAGWSTTDIVKAIRNAYGRDDSELSQEVHQGYLWMSDEDILAIVAYLKTLAPLENKINRRDVGFISRNTTGFWDVHREVTGYVPYIGPNQKIAYGKYLTDSVASCGTCHSSPSTYFSGEKYLNGGKKILRLSGEKLAPCITSLTTEGIGSWTEKDIVNYLETGLTPEKNSIDPEYCPHTFYRNASKQDLEAIAAYLKTVQ